MSSTSYFGKYHKFGSRNKEDPYVVLEALDNRTLIVEGSITGPIAGSYLNEGKVLIGDSNDMAQERSIGGDATLSSTGVLTLSDKITEGTYNLSTSIQVDSKGRVLSFGKVLDSGKVILGNSSNEATATSITGDIVINSSGTTTYNNILPMNKGGTGSNLTASDGGVVYSSGSGLGILSGIATAGKALLSQVSSAPVWSAFTLPTSTGINKILYSSADNTISEFGNVASSVLTSDSSGRPQFTSEIKTGNGSAAAPMYAFANSNTTGMWSSAANTINWSINGTSRMILAGTTLTVGQGAGAPFTIKALDAAVDGFNGSAMTFQASNGLGSGNGGNVNINGGQCGTSGTNGGSFNMTSGLGNTTGGGLYQTSGSVLSGNNGTTGGVIISSAGGQGAGVQHTGNFTIQTGPSVGTGANTGFLSLVTGNTDNNSGGIYLTTGTANNVVGSIYLRTNGSNTRMLIGPAGKLNLYDSTAATSSSAASAIFSGGLTVLKNIFLASGTGLVTDTSTGIIFNAGQQNDYSIKTGGQSSWIDLPAQITARTTGSNAPSYTIWNSAHSNNMYGYEFPNTGTKEIWAELHIPHEHTPGTGMYFHAHYLHNVAGATGNVKLSFDYTSAKAPDNNYVYNAFSGTTSNVTVTQAVGATQYSHHITELASPVLAGSLEVDTVVLVRMTRDNTVASNFSGSIWILFCDAHISVSKVSTLNRSKQQASNSFYT